MKTRESAFLLEASEQESFPSRFSETCLYFFRKDVLSYLDESIMQNYGDLSIFLISKVAFYTTLDSYVRPTMLKNRQLAGAVHNYI